MRLKNSLVPKIVEGLSPLRLSLIKNDGRMIVESELFQIAVILALIFADVASF